MNKNATKKRPSANATKMEHSDEKQPDMGSVSYLKFTARSGIAERSVIFPIPRDFEDWIMKLESLYGDPSVDPKNTFRSDGNRNMELRLSIEHFYRKF